ncbi:hypothetical protein Pint_14781 [Pistacia integerrima]|uniref:Uncharacterized protein n=1 Tax=Pistacia integerrima TaxID=434235 RepID=A0ACC0Z9E7_9ROSI|nr:hypothetical protein Pint_14781 [Pistacia integerrima]
MINTMLNIARRFFKLPKSERLKSYSDDPSKTTRLSTSFNVKTEKVANWRDFLRIHCYPHERYVHEWPTKPPSFREDVAEYCTSIRGLVLSNDRYKSVLHRAVVNCNKERISIPTFYCPSPDALIGLNSLRWPQVVSVLAPFKTKCCLDMFKTSTTASSF